jgi:hypothetical protein
VVQFKRTQSLGQNVVTKGARCYTDTAARKASHLRTTVAHPMSSPRKSTWLARFRTAALRSRRSELINACAVSDAPLTADVSVFIARYYDAKLLPIAWRRVGLVFDYDLAASS